MSTLWSVPAPNLHGNVYKNLNFSIFGLFTQVCQGKICVGSIIMHEGISTHPQAQVPMYARTHAHTHTHTHHTDVDRCRGQQHHGRCAKQVAGCLCWSVLKADACFLETEI